MTKAESEAIHQLVRMSLEWLDIAIEEGLDAPHAGNHGTNAENLRNMIQQIDIMAQEASKRE